MIEKYKEKTTQDGFAPIGSLLNAQKGNPYHDQLGRFTSGPDGGLRTGEPPISKSLDKILSLSPTDNATKQLNKTQLRQAIESEHAKLLSYGINPDTVRYDIKNMGEDTGMLTHHDTTKNPKISVIYINSKLLSSNIGERGKQELYSKDKNPYNTDSSFAGLIRHEYGHVKLNQLSEKSGLTQDNIARLTFAYAFNGNAADASKIYDKYKKQLEVSGYSKDPKNKKPLEELISESFSNPNFSTTHTQVKRAFDYVSNKIQSSEIKGPLDSGKKIQDFFSTRRKMD